MVLAEFSTGSRYLLSMVFEVNRTCCQMLLKPLCVDQRLQVGWFVPSRKVRADPPESPTGLANRKDWSPFDRFRCNKRTDPRHGKKEKQQLFGSRQAQAGRSKRKVFSQVTCIIAAAEWPLHCPPLLTTWQVSLEVELDQRLTPLQPLNHLFTTFLWHVGCTIRVCKVFP